MNRSLIIFHDITSSSTSAQASGWDFDCAFVVYDLCAIVIYGILLVWIFCELIYVTHLVKSSSSKNNDNSSSSKDIGKSSRWTQKIFLFITLLQCLFRLIAFVFEPFYYPCNKRDVAEIKLPTIVTYLAPLGFCLFIIAFSILAFHFAEIYYNLFYLLHPNLALPKRKQNKNKQKELLLSQKSDKKQQQNESSHKSERMKRLERLAKLEEERKLAMAQKKSDGSNFTANANNADATLLFENIEKNKSKRLRRITILFFFVNVIFLVLAYVSLEIFLSKYDKNTGEIKSDKYGRYERYLDYICLLFGGLCLFLSVFYCTIMFKIYKLYEKLLTKQIKRIRQQSTPQLRYFYDRQNGIPFSWKSQSLPYYSNEMNINNNNNNEKMQNTFVNNETSQKKGTIITNANPNKSNQLQRQKRGKKKKKIPNATLSPSLSAATSNNHTEMDRSASQGAVRNTKANQTNNNNNNNNYNHIKSASPLNLGPSGAETLQKSNSNVSQQSQSLPNETTETDATTSNMKTSASNNHAMDKSAEDANVTNGRKRDTSRTYHIANVPYSPQQPHNSLV